MRKIQKLLIGIFLGGVLLSGVGTGIALAEYSSFTYAGEKRIGEENLVTRDFDHKFDPELGKIAVRCGWWSDDASKSCLEADENVPQGTIRYTITYNDRTAQPYLIYDDASEYSDAPEHDVQGFLDVGIESLGSDFALWMECKDEVLKDLKQHRIASYHTEYITDIKIKANPATMEYLLDETG